MTRLGTSLPLCGDSSPVRYLVGFFLPWHLPAAALEASRPANDTRLLEPLGNVNFGPNPGREPFEARFCNLAASGPQLKAPSGTIGKRPVLGQILAGSLLEPDFGNLGASGPQLKPPSGTLGKRPVLGQILAGSLLEPDFGNLAASGP